MLPEPEPAFGLGMCRLWSRYSRPDLAQSTKSPGRKFTPPTVRVKAGPPPTTELGLSEVTFGAPGGGVGVSPEPPGRVPVNTGWLHPVAIARARVPAILKQIRTFKELITVYDRSSGMLHVLKQALQHGFSALACNLLDGLNHFFLLSGRSGLKRSGESGAL
jgi:hypothetical protein